MKVTSYPKTKRTRLTGKALSDLKKRVIKRDDNSCQCPFCTGGDFLDPPHHIKFKSRGGSDTEENLILLCNICHGLIHQERMWIEIDGEGTIKFIKRD